MFKSSVKHKSVHVCSLCDSSELHIFEEQKKKYKRCYVLRNFILRLTLISESNSRSRIFFRSNASIYFEKKRHIESKYLYIIHPFSIFRLIWECFMVVIYMINLALVPIVVAYNLQHIGRTSLKTLQSVVLLTDMFCLIDIVIHCLTGYENFSVKEVYLEPKKIFRYYLRRGNFVIDLVMCIPFQVTRFSSVLSTTVKLYVMSLCLLKGYRSVRLYKYAKQLFVNWRIDTVVFKLVLHVLMTLLIIHWVACAFLIVPTFVQHRNPNSSSWIDAEGLRQNTTFERYSFAMFMASAAFLCIKHTPNDTRGMPDTIVLTLTYILGYVMCILIFVILFQMVQSFNTPATKYEAIMNQLNQYMRHRQLPLSLQHRLVQYYGHRFQKTYFREAAIMPILSDRLQLEINLHCYTTLVENVSILHDLPEEVVSEIVSNLKSEVFLPNDIIIKAGTTGDCMYFIASGTVSVSTLTGREVCHLQDGAYFGEIALIKKDQKRIANVLAIEICEMYKLDRKVFKKCLTTFPDVYKKLEKIAQDRFNRTNFLEELHKKHILERTLARKHDLGD